MSLRIIGTYQSMMNTEKLLKVMSRKSICLFICSNLSNKPNSVFGSASSAAAFLEYFVEKGTKWIHCDLAGPAYLKKPSFPMPSHGTGFGIQTLLQLLSSHKSK